MGDRFLVGYPHGGAWHKPNMKVVSLYVDQKPEGDQSGDRAQEFGFKVYPTIAETLRCGGKKLAVDAVLIIGEHGNYPRNEKGQVLYPRYEFFEQCVKVFEQDGRAVPVYNDKHLSYSFEKAKAMVDASRRLRFPMLAGSSIPVTWRLPVDRSAARLRNRGSALMVGVGGIDAMDFHALEGLQCMVERRRGGETGVKAVQLLQGDAVWKAGDEGRYSKESADGCALAQRHAARADGQRTAARRIWSALRPVAEAGEEPGGVFHRVSRRPQGDHADARRRAQGFQLRGAVEAASPRILVHAVPADSGAERHLLRVPDAQGGADVRNRRRRRIPWSARCWSAACWKAA